MKEHKAKKRFMDLNLAMQQYFIVTGRQLEPLPTKPVLSNYYMPSEDHHNHELAFITISVTRIELFWVFFHVYNHISDQNKSFSVVF